MLKFMKKGLAMGVALSLAVEAAFGGIDPKTVFAAETEELCNEDQNLSEETTSSEETVSEEITNENKDDFLELDDNSTLEFETGGEYRLDDKDDSDTVEGDSENNDNTINESPDNSTNSISQAETDILADEPNEEADSLQESSQDVFDEAAFDESKTIDGVVVSVFADKGVFPQGSRLEVHSIDTEKQTAIEEAVEQSREDGRTVAASYTFDVQILDKAGKELEPNTKNGRVFVSFQGQFNFFRKSYKDFKTGLLFR